MARCLREYPALLRLRMALEAEIAAYRYAGGAGGAGGARGSARACLLQGDAGGRRAAPGLSGPAMTGPQVPLRDPALPGPAGPRARAPRPQTSAPRGPQSPRSLVPRDLRPRTLWTPLDSWSPGPSVPLCHGPPGLLGPPATRAPQTPALGGPSPPGGQRPRGRTLSPASPEQQRGWGPGPRGSTSIKPRGITRSRPVCGGGAASPSRTLRRGHPTVLSGSAAEPGDTGQLHGGLGARAVSCGGCLAVGSWLPPIWPQPLAPGLGTPRGC